MVSRHPLEESLGYCFKDPALLQRALTHRSAVSGQQRKNLRHIQSSNERLEFLGDRVLGLVIADMLLATYPEEPEGDLALRYAALVRAETLTDIASRLALERHLHFAEGKAGQSKIKPVMLSDACEAVIGALYLDGGLDPAAEFIVSYWTQLMVSEISPPRDSKTVLQEWAQSNGLPLPHYTTVHVTGPDHEPLFCMQVSINGFSEVTATGPSKQIASQSAARAFLETLD